MGFNLGGIFKSLVNPATLLQLAAGPAGWASLAMRTIGSAIMNQVIQAVGQKLGLPQSMISLAQSAFAQTSGTGDLGQKTIREAVSDFAKQANLSPSQEGNLERSANKAASSIMDNILREMKSRDKGEKEGQSADQGISKKGGFLRAIAMALGAAADQKMQEMSTLAGEIQQQVQANGEQVASLKGLKGEKLQAALAESNQNSQVLGTKTSLLQSTSQELSILQNVISTTLKTVGEAQSTIARKG